MSVDRQTSPSAWTNPPGDPVEDVREAFDPLVRARERIVAEDATELRVVARFSDVSVVTCRHCRHMEDAHRPDGSCEVEVSDWGTLDCTCPGFEPMQP